MNCRTARKNIALLVGDDLSQAEAAELMVHLRACPDCAASHREMSASTDVLARCNEDPVSRDRESLWPDVRGHLHAIDATAQPGRRTLTNTRMALAVAACVVVAALAPDLLRYGRTPPLGLRTLPVSTLGELESSSPVPRMLQDGNYTPVYSNASWQALEPLQSNRGGDFDPRIRRVRRVAGY